MLAAASPAANADPVNGITRILVSHSEKCLSIPGGSHTVGVQATQFNCEPNTAAKRFDVQVQNLDAWDNPVFSIKSVASGLCLDVANTRLGEPVIQDQCSPYSLWSWDKGGRLVWDPNRQLCLAVPHAYKSDNVGLILWTCNGGREQEWSEY
jgi:hypothetical protein